MVQAPLPQICHDECLTGCAAFKIRSVGGHTFSPSTKTSLMSTIFIGDSFALIHFMADTSRRRTHPGPTCAPPRTPKRYGLGLGPNLSFPRRMLRPLYRTSHPT